MKRILLISLLSCCAVAVQAQAPAGWQNLSPDEGGIYGAAVEQMHLRAEGMKPAKKPVTVALIGYGIDIGHSAIREAVWVNPKEKANGKDDDRNGWTDDLHGWNFLGNDTTTLDRISREGEREYLRLKEKYENYFSVVDGKVYRYDSVAQKAVEAPYPEDRKEFEYFLRVKGESEIAQAYGGVRLGKVIVAYIRDLDRKLKAQHPGKKLTRQDFQAASAGSDLSTFESTLINLVDMMFLSTGNDDWDTMVEYASSQFVRGQQASYEQVLRSRTPREGVILGDDPYDLNDKGYGNPDLSAENAPYGTMLAGLIAGRSNENVSGVAPNAKIMALRVDAGEQDESRVKDVALAIRYAVDKGAQVIQLGRGNTLYPYPYGEWVDEALRYAEQQGVLVVIPVMDLSYDLGVQPFYPNRHIAGGDLTNVITVAASDHAGHPFKYANYSTTELDLFAPGVDVESAYRDNAYAIGSGSAYAAAMVTGTAAFIKSYYPGITPAQMRKLLMETVTPRKDVEIEKQFYLYRNGQARLTTDLFLFDDLSASGGILNAARAFEAAGKR
jgi:subtilisin family serine protease